MELEAGCRVPVPQLMISHAMGAMDTAESRSSSIMGEGCEGKGREEGSSEGKSKEAIMRWEEDDTTGIKFWGALEKLRNWWSFLHEAFSNAVAVRFFKNYGGQSQALLLQHHKLIPFSFRGLQL